MLLGIHIYRSTRSYLPTHLYIDLSPIGVAIFLNLENDITLNVNQSAKSRDFSEKLDYESINRLEDKITFGLEWAYQAYLLKCLSV